MKRRKYLRSYGPSRRRSPTRIITKSIRDCDCIACPMTGRAGRPGLVLRVLSVPHSGTRFLHTVLQSAGYREQWYKTAKPGDFVFAHFYGERDYNPVIYELHQYPTLIPLRRFSEVAASWERRGKRLAHLRESWDEMQDFIQAHPDVYLLHVDDPTKRDREIQAIADLLGQDLAGVDFGEKIGHGN